MSNDNPRSSHNLEIPNTVALAQEVCSLKPGDWPRRFQSMKSNDGLPLPLLQLSDGTVSVNGQFMGGTGETINLSGIASNATPSDATFAFKDDNRNTINIRCSSGAERQLEDVMKDWTLPIPPGAWWGGTADGSNKFKIDVELPGNRHVHFIPNEAGPQVSASKGVTWVKTNDGINIIFDGHAISVTNGASLVNKGDVKGIAVTGMQVGEDWPPSDLDEQLSPARRPAPRI
jgi:hypothetical protein